MRSILQPAAWHAVDSPVPILAAILLFISSAALAQTGLKYRVEINAPKDMAEVLSKGLNLERWQDDPQMTPEQLRRLADEAVREARELAATEGYFSPRVEISIEEGPQPWTVRLMLQPGERVHIGEIDLRFTGPAVEDPRSAAIFKRVRDAWPLRRGEPFRQADWDAAKGRALRELSSFRYAGARIVASEALIDRETRRASLMVELDSGPPFRFGEIRVIGTRRYSDALVQNLSPFRPGEDYDRDKLVVYQRLLLESGYFMSVQADVDRNEVGTEGALVRLVVIEAPRHNIEAGVSYSTDTGPGIRLNYSNQALFDSEWRFRANFLVNDTDRNLQFNFDSPPQRGGYWNSFLLQPYHETDVQNVRTRAAVVGASRNWGAEIPPSAVIFSANYEEESVSGGPFTDRHAVYFGYRRTFRRTDDFISPRRGYLAMFEVGGAPEALATRPFFRGIASGSYFLPFGRNGDILLRGQVGRVLAASRDDIPSNFLFRTGGDTTVRGYDYLSLGVQQGDAVLPGRRLLVMSTEYTHWIGESWGIGVFVDAGDAWDDTTLFQVKIGYGVGARVRTPIGPIRVDLAYGQAVSSWRLHFSVGFTF
jgi:translocation and assembly module TamA